MYVISENFDKYTNQILECQELETEPPSQASLELLTSTKSVSLLESVY